MGLIVIPPTLIPEKATSIKMIIYIIIFTIIVIIIILITIGINVSKQRKFARAVKIMENKMNHPIVA